MEDVEKALGSAVSGLSDQNYTKTLEFYRFWIDIGQTYHRISPDHIIDSIWNNRATGSIVPRYGQLIHSSAHLILRLASDAESDGILAPYSSGLQDRLSSRTLRSFFANNLNSARSESTSVDYLYAEANLIAHWANLGYVEEAAMRHHVLQSLISHTKFHDHQADALIILFKLAGATFEAYADPSVVDRCFELLKSHSYCPPYNQRDERYNNPFCPDYREGARPDHDNNNYFRVRRELVQMLGASESPVTPVVRSPSISISALSDFTVADASDDEFSASSTFTNTFTDEPLIDPTAAVPHETFYLDDGNVEVLCGNTLFRVHVSTLSFHSPALRRMFARASLVAAESPNGCPRILSSDSATDFVTLLNIVYLPEFPERNRVPDFTTFSSLLRITTKYEMPAVRSRILGVVRNAYPETFEGLIPSKQIGESIFSGQTPHPNEVLSLFVQQKLTSALPIAYYMAARSGLDSLMDLRLPAGATLPPEVLRVAIKGLLALRGAELNETHCLILGSRGSRSCSQLTCPSRSTSGPVVSEAHQKVIDRIADSVHSGTKILEVLSLKEVCGGGCFGFCESCIMGWEAGHVDVRKNAWGMLQDVFGPSG